MMTSRKLLNWPPPTDLDENGYIEFLDLEMFCDNWLEAGAGDFNNDGVVDLPDFAEFGLAW